MADQFSRAFATRLRPLTACGRVFGVALAALLLVGAGACGTERKQEGETAPGVTDKEVLIGGSFPFSGPLAVFGANSKGLAARFEAANAAGGVNGRKIKYKALDDAYDPARGSANARRLVQSDKVFAMVGFGATALAQRDFTGQNKTPFFVFAGNKPLSDIKGHPYTRAWWPEFTYEMAIVAKHAQDTVPNSKFGTVMLNNEAGKDMGAALRKALGDRADSLLVKETNYEPTDADVSSQVNQVRAAGANVLVTIVTGPAEIQMLRYIRQIGWKPKVYVYSQSSSIDSIMKNVGLERAAGVNTALWLKDPSDPQWQADLKQYRADIEKYGGGAPVNDVNTANGYALGDALVEALKRTKEPTQGGLMKAWDSIKGVKSDLLYPGVQLNAGPGGRLIYQYQVAEFDGKQWKAQGQIADGLEVSGG